MGGGGKKPTLSQMVKRMEKQRKQQQQERRETTMEKSVLGLSVPNMDEVISFVKGLKYVTPYVLAEKFGFRISLAKKLLTDLAGRGLLYLVAGDNRIRIYAPVTSQAVEGVEEKQQAEAVEKKRGGRRRKQKAEATAQSS